MKKLICILCLALLVSMSACSKKEETGKDDEKDKVVIKTNEIYSAPNKASDAQIKLYNALSDAIEENEEEEVAKLVAQNFVMDFYTLKNKKNSEDIGGLTYIPENRRSEFATYASIYAYANYEKISQEYGDKHLPQVKACEVAGIYEKEMAYTDKILTTDGVEQNVTDTYNGYVVNVEITFKDTKVMDELPTSVNVIIIEMDDVYRVIGLE